MKNSKQLVSHLRSQSAFVPLNNQSCINAVKELLPPRLLRFILFGYIRHNIVFFALNHPGAKQEFDNIINSIKTPLRQMPPLSCKNYQINDIRAFVSHKKFLKYTAFKPIHEEFKERAEAKFDNTIQDEKLFKVFEEIRSIIKNK
ncbi:MAG TPA: hypothetical protein EYO73_12165 [Sulfurimonas sp.]|nr:hypothetical protein [Sulfurimonas sp.]